MRITTVWRVKKKEETPTVINSRMDSVQSVHLGFISMIRISAPKYPMIALTSVLL